MSAYVSFDGRTWPGIGERLAEVECALRYETPTREQLLFAASVLAAYGCLVRTSAKDRAVVARHLKAAEADERQNGGKS